MQKEYADTEKFVVVLSYVQELDQGAIDSLKKTAPQIPVYYQLRPPGSPSRGGLPDAYLYDHTGKIIKHDLPDQLYDLVEGLIDAAPDPIPPGILGDFEPKLLVEEARQLEDPARPAAKLLKELEALRAEGGERASEAGALLARVQAWLPAEVERLERIAKRRPGTTAYFADQFLTRFKGVDKDLEARVKKLHKKLKATPEVETFVRAMKDLERARTTEDARKAKQFEKRARKAVDKILKSRKASRELKKEASGKLVF